MSMTEQSSVYALLVNGSTVKIRPARPGDYDAVKAMHQAMSPDNAYLRFFSLSRLAAEAEARRICRQSRPGRAALLALEGGEVVGVAGTVYPVNPHARQIGGEPALASPADLAGWASPPPRRCPGWASASPRSRRWATSSTCPATTCWCGGSRTASPGSPCCTSSRSANCANSPASRAGSPRACRRSPWRPGVPRPGSGMAPLAVSVCRCGRAQAHRKGGRHGREAGRTVSLRP